MSVPSVNIAKDRLRTLLIADRIQCAPDVTEKLSKDIFQAVSKYVEISREDFSVQITRSDIHIRLTGEKN